VPQLEIERDFSTHSAPLRARLSVEMTKVAFKADCRSNNNATLTSLCEATARQGERRYKKGERGGHVARRIVRT